MVTIRLRAMATALATVLLLSACGSVPGNSSAEGSSPRDPATSSLLFSSMTPGENTDIYVAVVGQGRPEVQRLTDYAGPDNQPAWSPDHSKIAFVSDRQDPGNMDVYVMNADGTNIRRVTSNPDIDGGPAWAPDGTRLALERTGPDGHPEIFVASLDGPSEVQITDNDVLDVQPAWSPDGASIAFTTNATGDSNIRVADVLTGAIDTLIGTAASESGPAWSPSGRELAFLHSEETSSADVWIASADGGSARPWNSYAGSESSPVWADDNTILVLSLGSSAPTLLTMRRDNPKADETTGFRFPLTPPIDI